MFDAAFWATAGTISPWAIVSAYVLAQMRGWLEPRSHLTRLDADHTKQLADLRADHAEKVAILKAQIDTMTVAHDKQIGVITTAHNLRVTEMTTAHDKAREDHQKQIDTITAQANSQYDKAVEMATQQVTWSVTRGNDWKEAYDEQNQSLPLIAHSVEQIAKGQEAIVAMFAGIRKVAESNGPSD